MRKTTSIMLFLLAIACFWVAGARQDLLLEKRADYHLDSGKPLENAPPLMAFTTVVLGGFSGMLADMLWLRISYLQDDGRYLEVVQLADWITKLEPRCEEIWSFHAGNMAYNISVAMSEPEDRWRWVSNGIKLLRDEGMNYNPADAGMYFDLGWLFQDKLGRDTDRANRYYKFKWTQEMTQLFDGSCPDYRRIASDSTMRERFQNTYKLIPGIMKEVDAAYGPLDWRLPYAHAIYWAYRGRQRCDRKSVLQYDRMIYQSMALAFMNGRIVSDDSYETFAISPDLDSLPSVLRTFDAMVRKYPHMSGVESAYMSFLSRGALLLHDSNRPAESRSLYDLMCKNFPSKETAAGYEEFVAAVRAEVLAQQAQAAGK
jgi:hypothetical protein